MKLCRAQAMPAVAITDTGNLFGALEFATACAEAGIQPIIGIEIALAPSGAARAPRPGNGQAAEPDRIVLLAQNETGYRNLMGLTSRAYLEGEAGAEPNVAIADLAGANEGLICLAGGAGGPIGRLVAEGQTDAAEAALLALKAAFPARLYIELQRHGMPEEARSEAGLSTLPMRTTCRWSRPTTPISPTASSMRRMTRCCASRKAASSRTRTAGG